MGILKDIIGLIKQISNLITNIYKYRTVYKAVGVVATRKFEKAKKNHKYAILIAARNEETVIEKLLESIKLQDYPSNLITTFVVADNCTDNTANISKRAGAVCYERKDEKHKTKGYALKYLVECISRDYGIEKFEGYFIFDADNLLSKDYITRMNESFDAGEKIITSYRNTKNFDDNWISASYALHWLRTIREEHRARSVFGLATRIQGTGFLFANELIKNGWNYTSLTEDRAFCADAVANGYSISYNNDAVFYDEQPTCFKSALTQRIRWSKGHLQAFVQTGGKLFLNIINPKFCKGMNFKQNIKQRFMSFDMLSVVYPRSLTIIFKRLAVYMLSITVYIIADKPFDAFLSLTAITLWYVIKGNLKKIITAVYIFIIEYKRIKPIIWYKKLLYCLTFPLFDIIGKLSLVIALFSKPEWEPTAHNAVIDINDIENIKPKSIPNTVIVNEQTI